MSYFRRGYNWEQIHYIPAPTGGWNPDANPWELPANEAAVLDNFLIRPGKIVARGPIKQVNDFHPILGNPLGMAGFLVLNTAKPTAFIARKTVSVTQTVDPWFAPIVRTPDPSLIASPSLTYVTGTLGDGLATAIAAGGNLIPGPRSINFSGVTYAISYGTASAPVQSVSGYYAQSTSLLCNLTPTGALRYSSAVTDVTAGTGTVAWTNLTGAQGSGGSGASVALGAPNVASHYLTAEGYGFAVPAGAVVTGIQVGFTANPVSLNWEDVNVTLLKAGAAVGANKASNDPNFHAHSYGGPTDLWGAAWLPGDINNATFGVQIQVKAVSAAPTVFISSIAIAVYYTTTTSLFALENAPHGALDLKGHLSRVWLLGGIDTPGGGSVFSPTDLFYTNPGTSNASTQIGSASADWKDPVTGLVNKVVMDNDERDPGVGLAVVRNGLLILRHSSLWLLRGTTTQSFTLMPVTRENGCVDARSIVECSRGVYFLSRQGLMLTDGVTVKNVSGNVKYTLQQAVRTFMASAAAGLGGYATAALTSQGQVLVSIGTQQTTDLTMPPVLSISLQPIWSGLFDPANDTWTRVTSQLWNGQDGTNLTAANMYPGWAIQINAPSNSLLVTIGDRYISALEDVDNRLGHDAFSFVGDSALYDQLYDGTYPSIPLSWKSKLAPVIGTTTLARKFGQAKRFFVDFVFGAKSLIPTSGWSIAPVNASDAAYTTAAQMPLGSVPLISGSVSGATASASPRIQRQTVDFANEIDDLGFDASWSDVNQTTQPTNVAAELYGIGVEFQPTRDLR